MAGEDKLSSPALRHTHSDSNVIFLSSNKMFHTVDLNDIGHKFSRKATQMLNTNKCFEGSNRKSQKKILNNAVGWNPGRVHDAFCEGWKTGTETNCLFVVALFSNLLGVITEAGVLTERSSGWFQCRLPEMHTQSRNARESTATVHEFAAENRRDLLLLFLPRARRIGLRRPSIFVVTVVVAFETGGKETVR